MCALPFRGALFDLDGTLLDSMYVWMEVDDRFFAERGMVTPSDYAKSLAGMSYREMAEYTKERFRLTETWEELVDIWMRMALEEYNLRVPLKSGSKEYLTYLKSQGVKLAVTTVQPPDMFIECLKRNGIYDLFDAFCSAGEHGKEDGALYLRAAGQLGIPPHECAVFEDIYEGIVGAKRVGMKAYCIEEPASRHIRNKIAPIADAMLDTLWDMQKYHPWHRRCVIFTAYCESPQGAYRPMPDDMILCADGGRNIADALGVHADCVLGDFDSSEMPVGGNVLRYPVEKDDTDTMLCIRRALEQGHRNILLIGGLGGRFGHTMANIQALLFAHAHGANIALCDGNTRIHILECGTLTLHREYDTVSVFALSPVCAGVCLYGLQYPLRNATLTNDFPIGCSNHFAEDTAFVAVREGVLLVIEENEGDARGSAP